MNMSADPEVETETELKKPNMYKVVLLNDDYTPMDFVITILQEVFNKNYHEASEIMLHVHENGRGIAGIYTYEIAFQKSRETEYIAKENGHPLKTDLEAEE